MAQRSCRITRGDKRKCSLETTTKMHEIRSTVRNVSTLPCYTKVIGPDFYLAPNCICCVAFSKIEDGLQIYICNKSDEEILIERTVIFYDCNFKKLHEEMLRGRFLPLPKDDYRAMLVAGVENSRRFDVLDQDTLIIDICVFIRKLNEEIICGESETDLKVNLSDDLQKMLENPVNSDVSLQVGDKRIPAHWSILCARSPYFKRMFDSGMQESVKNSITITDSSFDTIEKLIRFLYTAELDYMEEDIQEFIDLYYAADKYEVLDLKDLCANKIITFATPDKACQILHLAHLHNDEHLKKEVMNFIRLNCEAVFQTGEWANFKVSEPLAAGFCSFFCKEKYKLN